MHSGRPVTFDGPTHLTTMAQFAIGLAQHQFPVTWADGFGNYGMPIPIIAQQTTSYLGAFFDLVVHNIFWAYNLVVLTGTFLSALTFYYCLRYWYSKESSLAATLLFIYAPYKIINVFIRGDIPEFFVSVFLPLTILGFLYTLQKKKWWGLLLIIIGVSGIFLTHPIMTVPLGLILGPIWLILAAQQIKNWKSILATLFAAGVGALIAGYYLLPLFGEIKYFYYGSGTSHLIDNQYLSLQNYFQPGWHYFYNNDIGPRGQYIFMGSLEGVVFLVSCLLSIKAVISRKWKKSIPLLIGTILAGIAIFLTLPVSDFIYHHFLPLNNIQHPWRMMTALIFIPPFLLAEMSDRHVPFIKLRQFLVIMVVLFIIIFRIPQTYGKNYIFYPESMYFYTITNLHGTNLNTVWTGDTKSYPVKSLKYEVIEGDGKVINAQVANGIRHYSIQANQPIRMADYTFYFPGWKLFVDGKNTAFEFQDPNYRGVITYHLPPGIHQVDLLFTDTNIRKIGKILSVFGILLAVIWLWTERQYHWQLGKEVDHRESTKLLAKVLATKVNKSKHKSSRR